MARTPKRQLATMKNVAMQSFWLVVACSTGCGRIANSDPAKRAAGRPAPRSRAEA